MHGKITDHLEKRENVIFKFQAEKNHMKPRKWEKF